LTMPGVVMIVAKPPASRRHWSVEQLEDRLTPSWGTVPPAFLTPPSSFANLTLNAAGDLTSTASITANEIDWYLVPVSTGFTTVSATTPTSTLDTVIGWYNTSGQRLTFNDDITYPTNTDSSFRVELAAGWYFLGVTNFNGTGGGGYTLSIDAPAQPGTSLPSFAASAVNANLLEGNSGSTAFTFRVNRTGNTAIAGSVSYLVSGGSATAADFGGAFPSGTVNFAAGQTSATIAVNVVGDTTVEADESFTLNLRNPVNGTIGTATAGGTIRNDDVAVVPPTVGGFDIAVRVSGLSASQTAIFEQAAQRWERVIRGDLPNAVVNGVTVDDVLIDAVGRAIDGVGNVLGQAGPTRLRSGSGLPITGTMQFDTADLASLEARGELFNVIVHEMGHVLGIGTIWTNRGLLTGSSGSDPRFIGAQATAAYNRIFGTSATGVPVENTGGSGTRNGHWRESIFNNELMTGFLNGGAVNPLSAVTVASLADLGYVVDLNAADSFTPSGGGAGLRGGGGAGGASLRAADPSSPSCGCALCCGMLRTEPVVEAATTRVAAADWAVRTPAAAAPGAAGEVASAVEESRLESDQVVSRTDRNGGSVAASRFGENAAEPTADCPFDRFELSPMVG